MNKRNRALLVAAVGAALVLVASTAVRCAAVSANEAQPEAGLIESSDAGGGPAEGTEDMDTAEKVITILCSHAWQAESDAGATVEFRDGSLVEADGPWMQVTAFEVAGAQETDDHASLDVVMTRGGAGSFPTVIAVDGREGSLVVESDGFANATRYVQSSAHAGEVAVEGVCEPYTSLIAGKEAELGQAVSEYCRDRVPTATRATFDGEVYLDIRGGRVTATFHLDDAASTVLSVAYAGGAFEVAG